VQRPRKRLKFENGSLFLARTSIASLTDDRARRQRSL